MTEDLSAFVRISVSVNLVASLIVFVLASVIIMTQQFSNFQQRSSTAISYMQQGTLQRANDKVISAPAAYRILEEAQDATLSLTIVIDGHTYYDYTVLVENENKTREFYFRGIPDSSGSWDITLTER